MFKRLLIIGLFGQAILFCQLNLTLAVDPPAGITYLPLSQSEEALQEKFLDHLNYNDIATFYQTSQAMRESGAHFFEEKYPLIAVELVRQSLKKGDLSMIFPNRIAQFGMTPTDHVETVRQLLTLQNGLQPGSLGHRLIAGLIRYLGGSSLHAEVDDLALEYLRKAKQLNEYTERPLYPHAAELVAFCFLHGMGARKDQNEAKIWSDRAQLTKMVSQSNRFPSVLMTTTDFHSNYNALKHSLTEHPDQPGEYLTKIARNPFSGLHDKEMGFQSSSTSDEKMNWAISLTQDSNFSDPSVLLRDGDLILKEALTALIAQHKYEPACRFVEIYLRQDPGTIVRDYLIFQRIIDMLSDMPSDVLNPSRRELPGSGDLNQVNDCVGLHDTVFEHLRTSNFIFESNFFSLARVYAKMNKSDDAIEVLRLYSGKIQTMSPPSYYDGEENADYSDANDISSPKEAYLEALTKIKVKATELAEEFSNQRAEWNAFLADLERARGLFYTP